MVRTILTFTSLLLIASCSAIVAGTEIDPPVACATGITCPAGQRCAASQGVCITDDCGDGVQQAAEQCDDGNVTDGDGCESDCTLPLECGNHVVQAPEQCDDGPVDTANCDGDCTSVACGDGRWNQAAGEACDDGNQVTETGCPYGTPTCSGCSGDCYTSLSLVGPYCGDGLTDVAEEGCDDGNALACGTCSAGCAAVVWLSRANGSITTTGVPSSSILDGETFTISDGVNPPTVFEFDKNASVTAGRVGVLLAAADNDAAVATKIVTAINGVGASLLVTASQGFTSAGLERDGRETSIGNVAIIENVTNPGFLVLGMSGGAAGDCLVGDGCYSDADCAQGNFCGPTYKCGP